jgi:hypothetical protein
MTIDAFHPDYMKTHEPNFMKDFRTHEANRQAAAAVSSYVTRQRKVKPSHGTVFGISEKVKAVTAPAHMHRPKAVSLERTEYHTYSKAGAPKTRSQIMTAVVAKKRQENKNWGTALPESKNIPKIIPKDS